MQESSAEQDEDAVVVSASDEVSHLHLEQLLSPGLQLWGINRDAEGVIVTRIALGRA